MIVTLPETFWYPQRPPNQPRRLCGGPGEVYLRGRRGLHAVRRGRRTITRFHPSRNGEGPSNVHQQHTPSPLLFFWEQTTNGNERKVKKPSWKSKRHKSLQSGKVAFEVASEATSGDSIYECCGSITFQSDHTPHPCRKLCIPRWMKPW